MERARLTIQYGGGGVEMGSIFGLSYQVHLFFLLSLKVRCYLYRGISSRIYDTTYTSKGLITTLKRTPTLFHRPQYCH